MTQTFRFGDMVKSRMHPNKTLGLVVDSGSNQYSYIIRWAHTKGVSQEHTESLELIPHPDTVRLDWLESKGWKPKTIAGGIIQLTRKAIDDVMCEKAV